MTDIEKIFKFLKENDMEQKELAEKLGIRPQCISDWKSGKTKSYKKHLPQIAKIFNVTIEDLLSDDELPKFSSSKNDMKISDYQFALNSSTDNLNEEDKQKVLSYSRFLEFQKKQRR